MDPGRRRPGRDGDHPVITPPATGITAPSPGSSSRRRSPGGLAASGTAARALLRVDRPAIGAPCPPPNHARSAHLRPGPGASPALNGRPGIARQISRTTNDLGRDGGRPSVRPRAGDHPVITLGQGRPHRPGAVGDRPSSTPSIRAVHEVRSPGDHPVSRTLAASTDHPVITPNRRAVHPPECAGDRASSMLPTTAVREACPAGDRGRAAIRFVSPDRRVITPPEIGFEPGGALPPSPTRTLPDDVSSGAGLGVSDTPGPGHRAWPPRGLAFEDPPGPPIAPTGAGSGARSPGDHRHRIGPPQALAIPPDREMVGGHLVGASARSGGAGRRVTPGRPGRSCPRVTSGLRGGRAGGCGPIPGWPIMPGPPASGRWPIL